MPKKKDSNCLQFLRELIRISGYTYKEIADMSQGQVTQIPYYLNVDSCKLSHALNICNTIGYRMTMEMVDENGKYIVNENARVRSGKRLDFLRNALARFGIAQKDVAEKMGLHANTLIYNFQVDDMSIPRIYEIAAALDLELLINITPIEACRQGDERRGCHVVTTITKTVDQHVDL